MIATTVAPTFRASLATSSRDLVWPLWLTATKTSLGPSWEASTSCMSGSAAKLAGKPIRTKRKYASCATTAAFPIPQNITLRAWQSASSVPR